MEKINVLVYGMTDKVGGMETFFINYYRMFDHTKIHFCFLTNYPTIALRDEIESNGDRVVSITKRSDNPIKNRIEMRRFFKRTKNQFDACYMMALDVANVDFLRYCKKNNIRVRILHSHNSGMRRPSGFKQKISMTLHNYHKQDIVSLATEYWACSKRAADWIFGKELSNRVKIIHNAIPVEKYCYNPETRQRIRDEYNVSDKSHIYGHVGRFMEQKNPLTLIDIFAAIITLDERALCWMVGDGPMREQIQEKIKKMGMGDKIILLGQKENVPELMQAMDCFVFPSLFEGLSLVMIEAQAAGLPILAADTLSKEHTITETIRYFSLDETPSKWAKEAIRMANGIPRESRMKDMIRAGYDIESEYKKIERFVIDSKK